MPVKIHEHMRCPICGRLARMHGAVVDFLPVQFRAEHIIEVRRQAFTGHDVINDIGTGFEWSSRPLRRQEAQSLGAMLKTVTARLEEVVEDANAPPEDPKAFAAWAETYLAEAETMKLQSEALYQARLREVARLHQERNLRP